MTNHKIVNIQTAMKVALGVLLMFGCANTPDGSNDRTNQEADTVEHASTCTGAQGAHGLSSVHEAGFGSQFFTLRLSLSGFGTQIKVEGWEVNPRTSVADEWDMIENVQGAVVERIAMRHGNEWYVALRSSTGTVRIECWELQRTDGAYFSGRRPATSGIGTGVETAALVVGINGNQYAKPADRPRPGINKIPVANGLSLPHIEVMSVDPDGRYLLMDLAPAGGGRQLIQVALRTSSSPPIAIADVIPLWDYSTLPEFPASSMMAVLEHPTKGRAIHISDLSTSVCLWDEENDGVFENYEVLPFFTGFVTKYPYMAWSRSF